MIITFSVRDPTLNIYHFIFLPNFSMDSTIKANIIQYATRSKAHIGMKTIRPFCKVLIYNDFYE